MAEMNRARADSVTKRESRFGSFADSYDSARPTYPVEAARWLTEGVEGLVVEVGAGTGKLTKTLVELGLPVLATEFDGKMLEVLRRRVPGAHALRASAEALPLRDGTVGAVVAAQAWHWFEPDRAWRSAQRVLTLTGRLSVVWNAPSLQPPWQREVAELGPVISPVTPEWSPAGLPREPMETRLLYWQERLTPRQVCDEYATHLAVRKLDTVARERYLAVVKQLATQQLEASSGQDIDGTLNFERLTWCGRLRVG